MNNISECLMCEQPLNNDLTIQQILSFQPVIQPVICQKCEKRWKRYGSKNHELSCSGCQRPLDTKASSPYTQCYHSEGENWCYDCYRWLSVYPQEQLYHQAIFHYNQVFREWITQYKYVGDVRMAHVMRLPLREMYRKYQSCYWTYLPNSPQSIEERGFPATLELLRVAQIPVESIFSYIGDGTKQAKKNRMQRMSLSQPFRITTSRQLPSDKPWVIFDDIYTTGATMHCAKSLLIFALPKGSKVLSLSLARDILSD